MTSFTAQVERINTEARQLDPKKVALTLLAVLPFVLGWTLKKVVVVSWVALSWLWTAAVVGWRAADAPRSGKGG